MSFDTLASQESIAQTIKNLAANHIAAETVATSAEALAKIKAMIPTGASVMNGASKTLEQIGFVEYLKSGEHQWQNMHAAILAEPDMAKQAQLRRAATSADYYLGSVHALTETGELLIASNTGSQLANIVYNSPNLIFVVGAQKIVDSFETGLQRLKEYVIPLEDVNMQEKYGMGTFLSKLLHFRGENPLFGRKFTVLIVQEKLGF